METIRGEEKPAQALRRLFVEEVGVPFPDSEPEYVASLEFLPDGQIVGYVIHCYVVRLPASGQWDPQPTETDVVPHEWLPVEEICALGDAGRRELSRIFELVSDHLQGE